MGCLSLSPSLPFVTSNDYVCRLSLVSFCLGGFVCGEFSLALALSKLSLVCVGGKRLLALFRRHCLHASSSSCCLSSCAAAAGFSGLKELFVLLCCCCCCRLCALQASQAGRARIVLPRGVGWGGLRTALQYCLDSSACVSSSAVLFSSLLSQIRESACCSRRTRRQPP